MPTYEYLCAKCGHHFELFQSMSADPLTQCPKDLCPQKKWGKGKVKKQLGAGAGLIFKGSGFYITDYRSKNYTEGAKKDSSSSSGSSSASGSSSGSSSGVGGGSSAGSGASSSSSSGGSSGGGKASGSKSGGSKSSSKG